MFERRLLYFSAHTENVNQLLPVKSNEYDEKFFFDDLWSEPRTEKEENVSAYAVKYSGFFKFVLIFFLFK